MSTSTRNVGICAGGSGFTLIEMLVSLLIVGLLSTLAVVRFSHDERRTLREEGERLALLLEQLTQDARVSGRVFAWMPEAAGYRFRVRDASGDWQNPTEDIYRPRALAEGVRLGHLQAEGRVLSSGEHLVFSPRSAHPFAVTVSSATGTLEVRGDTLGRITVHEHAQSATH